MSLAWMSAAAASAPQVRLTAGNGCLLAVLLVSALLVRLPRRGCAASGPVSTSGAWELPAVVLIPSAFAFIAPVAVAAIACWRIRRVPRGLDAVAADRHQRGAGGSTASTGPASCGNPEQYCPTRRKTAAAATTTWS